MAPEIAAFLFTHGVARVDDQRVVSGIVYEIRHVL
jgi:hypothetical protein